MEDIEIGDMEYGSGYPGGTVAALIYYLYQCRDGKYHDIFETIENI